MKLNGIRCDGFVDKGAYWEFVLSETTLVDVSALDGQDLKVTEDDGETLVASFTDHTVTDVFKRNASICLRAARELDPDTAATLTAIEENLSVVSGKAEAAKTAATEAKAAAETAQGAANPQVATFASIALPSMAATMTDEQAVSVSTLWPEWSADGVAYKADDVVQHGGHLYRCEQAHTSQADWTPDASASLWSRIDIAGDGIDVWTQPTGAHNAYDIGDKVHYPGADGPVYESTIDGNTWAPDAYPQGWTLVEETE